MSENVIRKDLGAVSAYALAVGKGYTGTEEEFALEQANFAKNAASVADAVEIAKQAKEASEKAKSDVEVAKEAAEKAKLAAETAEENAAKSATMASGSEQNAATSAKNAQKAMSDAEAAKEAATAEAEKAERYSESAEQSAINASNSETAAKGSEDAAAMSERNAKASEDAAKQSEETALQAANTAAKKAVEAAEYASDDAPPIVLSASGEEITITDSAERHLKGLNLYGKTTQDGTPSPEAPVELETVGVSGSIAVNVNGQTLAIDTPNGLFGIPVDTDGNYTDADGQQWVCDEIDLARGVYVQRIGKHIVMPNGVSGAIAYVRNEVYYSRLSNLAMLCNRFVKPDFFCISAGDANTNLANGQMTHFYQPTNAGDTNLYFKHSAFTDLATAQAWFTANETILLYPLSETVETPLTAEQLAAFAAMQTEYPNTTITNDGGAYMAVDYVADTKIYIDNKFAELQAAVLSMGRL